MKRIAAPKHWMLDKLTGVFAPRPSPGPHKLRECVPLLLLIRNRLKYALNYKECKVICNSRSIKVDSKIRTDMTYPCGFQDVISIEKTEEHFRLLHDTKGRFLLNRITQQEAAYKLCRVKALGVGSGAVPHITTHDGRTIRYPDPLIKPNDTVKVNLATNKIEDFAKFEVISLALLLSFDGGLQQRGQSSCQATACFFPVLSVSVAQMCGAARGFKKGQGYAAGVRMRLVRRNSMRLGLR